jgi:hypothetical protein
VECDALSSALSSKLIVVVESYARSPPYRSSKQSLSGPFIRQRPLPSKMQVRVRCNVDFLRSRAEEEK